MARLGHSTIPRSFTLVLVLAAALHAQQQLADPDFNTTVERPAYASGGPTVVIDEAHQNFHTANGRYKPLADLLRSDGYTVVPGTRKFDRESLAAAHVLVIANAGAPRAVASNPAAFTEIECDAVRDWVHQGGSLLLIADHAPFGAAAENLGKWFGVAMGKGWVFDRGEDAGSVTTQFVFTRENGGLADHPVTRGRNSSERITRIRSFTGQSLSVPDGATVLMKLSSTAREVPDARALNEAAAAVKKGLPEEGDSSSRAVAGRAQGIAMPFGKGKVVILGEAAMLSAQVVRYPEDGHERIVKVGMNVPGYDNKQFALNVVRWLSSVLE